MNTTTRKVPTLEAVKQALSKDWLERDGGSFVYQRLTGRLDWEKSLPSGSAYSEELLALDGDRNSLSEEAIIRKAYGMAQTVLDTLDIKGRVTLRFNSAGNESYTNGKQVTISTVVLDDKTVDITHRLDILLGTAEHEGLHCEFTDFKVHSSDQILQSLVNIVEDERIEHCAGDKYPGLANFLKEFKYYYFNLYRTRHRKELNSAPYAGRLINAIIALLRYPKALTDAELEEFGEYLVAIRKVTLKVPSSTSESMVLAQKIYDIIKDAVKQKPSPSQPQNGQGKPSDNKDKGDGQGEGGQGDDSGESEGKSGKSPKKGGKDGKEKGSAGGSGKKNGKKEGSGKDNGGDGDEEETGGSSETGGEEGNGDKEEKGAGKEPENGGDEDGEGGNEATQEETVSGGIGCDGEDTPARKRSGERETNTSETPEFQEKEYMELSPEDMDKALDVIRRMLRSYGEDTDSNGQQADIVRKTPRIDQLCTGEVERGIEAHTLFLKMRDDADAERQYAADLNAVRPFIPAMKNILVAQASRNVYRLKGMKTGRLDPGKLSQVSVGNPNVYLQQKEIKSSKVAVCVLVDESGSMGSMYREKITAARRTAVLLNEALGTLPNVDLFVYGHTEERTGSGASIEIRTYREHSVRNRHAIGGMEARSCNADGYAILEVARRVRRQTQEKVLFFIISDGAPASRLYSGNSGVAHTRDAVKAVTAQGFFPVQIAIDPCCDPATMFSNYVKFTNMSELPRFLSAVVKKAVLKNTVRF